MDLAITRKRFTYDDCLRMAEIGVLSPMERVELVDGEILLMSPTGPRHGAAVDGAAQGFVEGAARKAIGRTQGAVVLHEFAAPQPDIALLRPREDRYRHRNPGPEDILLIVEAADSSLEYDTTVKLGLYAILRIPEYWVADLQNNRLLVCREPYEDTYRSMIEFRPGDVVAPLLLPDCRIAVDLLLP